MCNVLCIYIFNGNDMAIKYADIYCVVYRIIPRYTDRPLPIATYRLPYSDLFYLSFHISHLQIKITRKRKRFCMHDTERIWIIKSKCQWKKKKTKQTVLRNWNVIFNFNCVRMCKARSIKIQMFWIVKMSCAINEIDEREMGCAPNKVLFTRTKR